MDERAAGGGVEARTSSCERCITRTTITRTTITRTTIARTTGIAIVALTFSLAAVGCDDAEPPATGSRIASDPRTSAADEGALGSGSNDPGATNASSADSSAPGSRSSNASRTASDAVSDTADAAAGQAAPATPDPALGYDPTPDADAPRAPTAPADGPRATPWPLPPAGGPDRAWMIEVAGIQPIGRLTPPHPPNNPPSASRVELGQLLFFDPVLAGERDVSCATCHHPDLAWADGRERSVGVGGGVALGVDRHVGRSGIDDIAMEETARNAPTLLNVGLAGRFGPEPHVFGLQFWDGRADKGLEAQALLPLGAIDEMAGHAFSERMAVTEILARLRAIPDYERRFAAAFPETQVSGSAITASTLARALAAFQRSLLAPDAPFDRWLEGEEDALDVAALRGLALFTGEAGCVTCHHGPQLSDYQFHVLGAAQIGPGRRLTRGFDRGRYDVTGDPADAYAFRTPPLRNVAQTAPYGHAGAYPDLESVIRFHLRGGNDLKLEPSRIDALLVPRDLDDAAVAELAAFLATLDGVQPDIEVPASVPSGLLPVSGDG